MAKKETKPAKPPAKKGRPTKYTPELAIKICEMTATHTMCYDELCEKFPEFPDLSNMRLWRYKYEDFRVRYIEAKRDQAELYIEEIRDRARDRRLDVISGEKGDHGNSAAVQRDRLIIDTDKWIAAKVMPRVYGERPTVDITNNITPEVAQQFAEMALKLSQKHERDY